MDISSLLQFSGPVIYTALAVAAFYGLFCVVLLLIRIKQKQFQGEAQAEDFLAEVRTHVEEGDYDAAAAVADTSTYWDKAVPQLVLLALTEPDRPLPSLRRLVEERFERDVLADLEYRHSWIGTIVKTAPMLGLLGTVCGMIEAFAQIASQSAAGTDPSGLAENISFALFTTALGLTVAIPLTLLGSFVRVRIGRLTDAVQQHLSMFLDDFETARQQRRG